MKKIISLFIILMMAVSFFSCSDNKDLKNDSMPKKEELAENEKQNKDSNLERDTNAECISESIQETNIIANNSILTKNLECFNISFNVEPYCNVFYDDSQTLIIYSQNNYDSFRITNVEIEGFTDQDDFYNYYSAINGYTRIFTNSNGVKILEDSKFFDRCRYFVYYNGYCTEIITNSYRTNINDIIDSINYNEFKMPNAEIVDYKKVTVNDIIIRVPKEWDINSDNIFTINDEEILKINYVYDTSFSDWDDYIYYKQASNFYTEFSLNFTSFLRQDTVERTIFSFWFSDYEYIFEFESSYANKIESVLRTLNEDYYSYDISIKKEYTIKTIDNDSIVLQKWDRDLISKYKDVVIEYCSLYGLPDYKDEIFINGTFCNLIDFNNDDIPELVLCNNEGPYQIYALTDVSKSKVELVKEVPGYSASAVDGQSQIIHNKSNNKYYFLTEGLSICFTVEEFDGKEFKYIMKYANSSWPGFENFGSDYSTYDGNMTDLFSSDYERDSKYTNRLAKYGYPIENALSISEKTIRVVLGIGENENITDYINE